MFVGGERVAFRRQIRKIDAMFFKVCRDPFAPQRCPTLELQVEIDFVETGDGLSLVAL
jgi:hypothetical protein